MPRAASVSAAKAAMKSLPVATRIALWKRLSGSANSAASCAVRSISANASSIAAKRLGRMAARRHGRGRGLDHGAHMEQVEDELRLGLPFFRRQARTSASSVFQASRGRARVPVRLREAIRPFADSSLKASRTTVRLAP